MHTVAVPLVIETHGLTERWRAGQVAVEDGPDPAAPNRTVTRARAFCAYDRLHSRGALSDEQREAADRYACLREAETGARWQNGEPARSANPWQKGHPILTQLQASAKLKAAHEVLGPAARVIVTLLVVDNLPVSGIAERLRADKMATQGRVVAALERLAEHWGIAAA